MKREPAECEVEKRVSSFSLFIFFYLPARDWLLDSRVQQLLSQLLIYAAEAMYMRAAYSV